MNITLATTATEQGGVWRHITDLATSLAARRCDVEIALPDNAPKLREAATSLGIDVVGLGEKGARGSIWHLHLANTFDRGAAGWMTLAKRRSAVVLTEHLPRTDASDPGLRVGSGSAGAWMTKIVLKRLHFALSDQAILLSEGSRRFVEFRYGLNSEKVVLIPNGLPAIEQIPGRRHPESTGQPTFVAAGALIRQKGFDMLIEAACYAKRTGPWWFLERAPTSTSLFEAQKPTEEESSLPALPTNCISSWRRASHSSCPRGGKASPYVVLEAMAIGKAVVGCRVDGISEMIVHGKTGLLVDNSDPRALAEARDTISVDPALASSMGQAGRNGAVEAFNSEQMVDRVLEVYASTRTRSHAD